MITGKGKVVPLDNEASRHENVWESGEITPSFLMSALDAGE